MPTITSIAPTQGHNGQSLVVTGTGFVAPAKVNFGTKSVTGTVGGGGTTVTCTIPTLCAGSYPLSVTQGTLTSNSVPFFYVGTPDCSGVVANFGPIAPGAVDIYGSALSTANVVGGGVAFGTVGTVTGGAVTVVNDGHLTVTPPVHPAFGAGVSTDTVDITVTTAGGASFSGGATTQFTYYNGPTVTGLSPATGSVGTSTTVTGTSFVSVIDVTFTPTGGGAATSADSFNVGPDDAHLVAVVPLGLAVGTYDVQVITPGGTSAVVGGDVFTVV
ncbi:IPT/TIG domain-containing protein [Streptomyces inhibens]|uniref:IPT/TIG domain-containing protein n=1 Tax=Streptomyces inhibens TaxID=2293571 RepID=UPI0037B566AC